MDTTPRTHSPGSLTAGLRRADPAAEALERIEGRLERLERALEPLTVALTAATPAAAIAADGIDAWARAHGASDVDARLEGARQLALRISRPETLARLNLLIDHFEAAPEFLAMFLDIVDEWVRAAGKEGVPVHETVGKISDVLLRLGRLVNAPEFEALLQSGVLGAGALDVMGRAAEALADAREAPDRVGLLGALGALRQPDVQRALGFALRFARAFGGALDTPAARLPAPRNAFPTENS